MDDTGAGGAHPAVFASRDHRVDDGPFMVCLAAVLLKSLAKWVLKNVCFVFVLEFFEPSFNEAFKKPIKKSIKSKSSKLNQTGN